MLPGIQLVMQQSSAGRTDNQQVHIAHIVHFLIVHAVRPPVPIAKVPYSLAELLWHVLLLLNWAV